MLFKVPEFLPRTQQEYKKSLLVLAIKPFAVRYMREFSSEFERFFKCLFSGECKEIVAAIDANFSQRLIL